MAVDSKSVKKFEDWYDSYTIDDRDGTIRHFAVASCGAALHKAFLDYKREMDSRVENFDKLIKMADAEVVSTKPDLPNVSSGEVAGMIRRMARNLVQHTPNVDIVSAFDDDGAAGVFVRQTLKSKIIGDDLYSNDMQQNLFASAKNALTIGFDCVIPVLLQDAAGGWYMKYDNIFYRDVFPEPGARDVRDATDVFVRRYLSIGEVRALCRNQVSGWDHAALKTLLLNKPRNREEQSVDHQTKKSHTIPDGYEVITYYSNTGDAFLTFDANTKLLLRIEKNKHPLKWHPVFFLVMEKDLNQPLGKSQVELVFGRQEFQDLMLNGAMKMWYRNINPTIIGYGTVNSVPNLSPGKFVSISNPNAKLEPFEVNTQTLLQHGTISQQNAANMTQLVGAADQQMAAQSTGGMMSQTPQGVEAQQAMVDITTNNYQKAIESFFSRYCSYALTTYFAELKGSVDKIVPTADTRRAMINGGLTPDNFDEDGRLKDIEFDKLAIEYFVRAVPGSLVELEDEKQIRILNQLFVPLSQAMPALGSLQDQNVLMKFADAMQFIVARQIELSGSAHSDNLRTLWEGGATEEATEKIGIEEAMELRINEVRDLQAVAAQDQANAIAELQTQNAMLREAIGEISKYLGVPTEQSAAGQTVVQV